MCISSYSNTVCRKDVLKISPTCSCVYLLLQPLDKTRDEHRVFGVFWKLNGFGPLALRGLNVSFPFKFPGTTNVEITCKPRVRALGPHPSFIYSIINKYLTLCHMLGTKEITVNTTEGRPCPHLTELVI